MHRNVGLLIRLAASGTVCVLLAMLIELLGSLASPTIISAQNLLGERWYAIGLSRNHIGYLHTRAHRDSHGRWLYFSELRFAMVASDPVTVSDSLIFDSLPPYRLLLGTHAEVQADQTEHVTIRHDINGYEATTRFGDTIQQHQPMPRFDYDLDDYLSFERWLGTATPRIGSVRSVPTVDFSNMQIVARQYRIVDRNVTGYLVDSRAPLDHTTIQLDADFAPVKLRMAGLFEVERTSKSTALRPRSALQSASYFIPANRRIPNHSNVERMVVGVHGVANANELWPNAVLRNGNWTMTLHANPISERNVTADPSALAAYSQRNDRISRLAAEAVRDVPDGTPRVHALTRFVHRFMSYKPDRPYRPVPALLDSPVGDCTEFADLFTALANSLGIPSRTVFGLAYRDGDTPAFVYHAWNEVMIDNAWQAVDPTWNQLRVDATHIPLPSSQSAALQLLTGVVQPSFSVEHLVYFDSVPDRESGQAGR